MVTYGNWLITKRSNMLTPHWHSVFRVLSAIFGCNCWWSPIRINYKTSYRFNYFSDKLTCSHPLFREVSALGSPTSAASSIMMIFGCISYKQWQHIWHPHCMYLQSFVMHRRTRSSHGNYHRVPHYLKLGTITCTLNRIDRIMTKLFSLSTALFVDIQLRSLLLTNILSQVVLKNIKNEKLNCLVWPVENTEIMVSCHKPWSFNKRSRSMHAQNRYIRHRSSRSSACTSLTAATSSPVIIDTCTCMFGRKR